MFYFHLMVTLRTSQRLWMGRFVATGLGKSSLKTEDSYESPNQQWWNMCIFLQSSCFYFAFLVYKTLHNPKHVHVDECFKRCPATVLFADLWERGLFLTILLFVFETLKDTKHRSPVINAPIDWSWLQGKQCFQQDATHQSVARCLIHWRQTSNGILPSFVMNSLCGFKADFTSSWSFYRWTVLS